jgi:apolipoprotein N-acyltransferase
MAEIAAPRETPHNAPGLQPRGFVPGSDRLLAACPLATAALLCLCLTTSAGIDCCWVALVPFGLALAAHHVPRATFAAAYLAGLCVHLVGMSWVLDCYRYQNHWGPYYFEWFWIGAYGGVLLFLTLVVGRMIAKRLHLPMMILLPALWVAFEFVRQELAGWVVGIDFPWLKLGTALVASPRLLQLADLGGELLLTLLVAFINGAVLDVLLAVHHHRKLRLTDLLPRAAVVGAAILAATEYGQWRIDYSEFGVGPTVCLLGEIDLPPILPDERLHAAFIRETGAAQRADLLLWPELAYHHPIVDSASDSPDVGRQYLEQTSKRLQATLVIGCEHQSNSARYNAVACVGPQTGFLGCYDKRYLVPGVENDGQAAYLRGRGPGVFRLSTPQGEYHFGTAVCYDLCFSEHFRKLRRESDSANGVDFFVQSGAEGQDGDDVVADWMLLYARLRAVESRRPLVRNATLGHSALIDGNGTLRRVLPTTPIDSPTWLGTIPLDDRFSLYSIGGDWVGSLSLSTIAVLLALSRDARG